MAVVMATDGECLGMLWKWAEPLAKCLECFLVTIDTEQCASTNHQHLLHNVIDMG